MTARMRKAGREAARNGLEDGRVKTARRAPPPLKIVMMPSVGGGIGHISRTAALARALLKQDPTVRVEYLLDTDRLRPFNIDATMQMGFRPRFLPPRNRENRDAIVRACLGDANLVVDDVARYLLPLRQAVPHVGWITIAMHPIGDELFMDWPFMAQMDAVIWAYAPLVGLPPELESVAEKVVRTGPFLETDDVPDKAAARAQLGLPAEAPLIVYAPRGFPFGREFGHRVLSGVYAAVAALRRGAFPDARLALLAVTGADELRGVEGVPEVLPEWVRVRGVVKPRESLLYTRAADAVLAEGTSTMHEGAALGTPLVLVPGPIQEATLLARKLGEMQSGALIEIHDASAARFEAAFIAALAGGGAAEERLRRARELVTGGGGVAAAAKLVLATARRYQAAEDRRRQGGVRQERARADEAERAPVQEHAVEPNTEAEARPAETV